ncbi:MAG: hypothetical protein WDN28_22765 [Chthoniobacter sp.]
MKRRDFLQNHPRLLPRRHALKTSAHAAADSTAQSRDLYELRAYTLKTAKKPLLDAYLGKAFIPR